MFGNGHTTPQVDDRQREQDRKHSRRAALIGLLVLGALLILLLFRCQSTDQLTFDNDDQVELEGSRFHIDGDTDRYMSPGATVRIDLAVTNPQEVAMTVSGLAIALEDVTAPRADRRHPCSVDDFLIEQPDTDLRATVPAGTSRTLSALGVDEDRWPRVGMVNRPVNQDGCKGARVTLTYSGTGTLQDP